MSLLGVIAHPVFTYGLLAVGIALCLYLFVTVKQDLQRIHLQHRRAEADLDHLLGEVSAKLGTTNRIALELEEALAKLPQMSDPRPGMNISRRTQVLRMHRRGERPEQISAALRIPLNEVELLLKLSSQQSARVA
jgi:hypothetical protein